MGMMNAPWTTRSAEESPVSVTIVDADADSAEALQALVSAHPGVVEARAVAGPAEAITLLGDDAQVTAYAAGPGAPPRRIVLIDLQPDDPSAPETLALLRSKLPDVKVVMLCLYPEQSRGAVCDLADRCVPKDTTPADLCALLDDVLGTSGSGT